MTKTRPTLATIAKELGISRMTVSNAFNRPDQLSPELRERVLAKAAERGYGGPDPGARALSRGRTGSVGVVLDAPLTVAFSDPAAVQVMHGVATVCEERELGMTLVPRIVGHDAELVKTALVDGFVVYCMGDDDPRLHAMNERRLPYVLIDHAGSDADLTVGIDDRGAARATMEHLIGLGHRRFGAVLGWDVPVPTAEEALAGMAYYVARERLGGWQDAIRAAGLDWESVPIASANGFGHETGRAAGGKLLDRADRPTAIVCMSDVLAIGVLDAAKDRGVDVPGQLSVTGFDDVPEALAAGLTTIRQPHQDKGAEALRLLLGDQPHASVLLPTELVPRHTTGPAPS
jgi:DNA-binding LacI/PurR family transcriptional regulator